MKYIIAVILFLFTINEANAIVCTAGPNHAACVRTRSWPYGGAAIVHPGYGGVVVRHPYGGYVHPYGYHPYYHRVY
jgi:hypothetical protein